MINPLVDYVFFTVEKEKEDTMNIKNGVLHLANFAEHGKYHRIYGDVIGVPGRLSRAVILRRHDAGFPEPRRNYSGEMVEKLAKQGHTISGNEYECTPYEPYCTTLAEIVPEVKTGDRIYFHYNTIDEENKYTLDNGQKIYKVRYDQIICAVRNGSIIPIGSHVLVAPLLQDGVLEVFVGEKKIMGKVGKGGLITEISKATEDLEHVSFKGELKHIGAPLKDEPELDLKPGDTILCLPNANWVNVIEGKEFFVMKQRDIISKIK